MYQDHFGLNRKPFGIVPDTRFLFLSDSHREAIAHLVYALNEKNGFVQLTGEVGVGKTMACRFILANIPEDIDVALIINPRIDEISLLRSLCQELDIPFSTQQKTHELTQLINSRLLDSHARGRHTILIIDEAQNLPKRTLEQLRLLTNLETDTQKLLRIILIGQPELAELLSAHDMRQVAQRITSRYRLTSLSPEETDAYISHRLAIAGCNRRLFSRAATHKIHKLTGGTPRLINMLCDHALIGSYSQGRHRVDKAVVRKAAKEVLPTLHKQRSVSRFGIWLIVLLLVLLSAAIFLYRNELGLSRVTSEPPSPAVAAPQPAPQSTPAPPQDSLPDTARELPEIAPQERVTTPLPPSLPAQSPSPPPLLTPPALSAEKFEQMEKQAEADFRLNIPVEQTGPADSTTLGKPGQQ